MLEPIAYGAALAIAICCLGLIDYRYKLAFFYNRRRTLHTVALAMAFFIVWDVIGIILHIFYTGSATVITRIFIGPNFPVEELLFLLLLVYSTLILWRSSERWF